MLCPSIRPSVPLWQIFVNALFSATMHHSHFKHGMVLRLGVLHVAYQIHVSHLSTSCFSTLFIFRHYIHGQAPNFQFDRIGSCLVKFLLIEPNLCILRCKFCIFLYFSVAPLHIFSTTCTLVSKISAAI